MNERQMENRLKEKFPQCQVAVLDLNGASNHFEVRIKAPELDELSRIQKHQSIMAVFKEELASGEVHALAIKPIT